MNIKKMVSYVGYTLLQPISLACKMSKSKMSVDEAHRVISSVYDIDRGGLDFVGGVNMRHAYSLTH